MEKHPWTAAFAGIGLKISGAIVGEIIKAKLAEAIGGALGGGGGGGALAGAGAGKLGSLAGVAAPWVAGAVMVGGSIYGTYMQDDPDQRKSEADADFNSAKTPGQKKELALRVASLRQKQGRLNKDTRTYQGYAAYLSEFYTLGKNSSKSASFEPDTGNHGQSKSAMMLGDLKGMPSFDAIQKMGTIHGKAIQEAIKAAGGLPVSTSGSGSTDAGPRGAKGANLGSGKK